MIILDENIIASQRLPLRKWRIRFMQIGKETGRQGMKDLDEIIPLLHLSRRPTFFTHDLGFFDHSLCHNGYALICLDVRAKETSTSADAYATQSFKPRNNDWGKSFWHVKKT